MWDGIADGPGALLECLVLGALLSCVYDVFRVRREVLPLHAAVIFVEDVVYGVFSSYAFFLVLMDVSNGEPRWWLAAGSAAGWLACHFSIGFVLMALLKTALRLARLCLWLVLRYVVRPIWLACRRGGDPRQPRKITKKLRGGVKKDLQIEKS